MNIAIIGQGRIAGAIRYYIDLFNLPVNVITDPYEEVIKSSDLIIGVLPGGLGEKSLELALKYNIDLIDLADLETDFYLEKQEKISEAGITVIPGAGFCPGLVNFILGHEFSLHDCIDTVEVMAGSLSEKKDYFPFLWCFEDMVLEFLNPSLQLVNRQQKEFVAFDGYRNEKLFGIDAESYLCASGFENLLNNSDVEINNFYYRNIRPVGFMYFFKYLHNYGFFKEDRLMDTKKKLEKVILDNISCSVVSIQTNKEKYEWQIKSQSSRNEKLNSMQKITALFSISILKIIIEKKLDQKGLIFCEGCGKNEELFNYIINFLINNGIDIKQLS